MEQIITFLIVVFGFLVGDFLKSVIKDTVQRKKEKEARDVEKILHALNDEFNKKFKRGNDTFINH